MLLMVSSFFLALMIVLGQLLLSKKIRIGWLVLLIGQLAWVPYDMITKQYGFLLITMVAVPICIFGWKNFKGLDTTKSDGKLHVVTTQHQEETC